MKKVLSVNVTRHEKHILVHMVLKADAETHEQILVELIAVGRGNLHSPRLFQAAPGGPSTAVKR